MLFLPISEHGDQIDAGKLVNGGGELKEETEKRNTYKRERKKQRKETRSEGE